ncbi:MAG: hypothetical protein COC19_02515 [SAR86 cluster bacterium]|uniref:Uncharacterized protein n=1 Tax=SAR86 cluster bacterium TaxID=2030880 RepID=A0A2A4MRG4_9GAMM|nr:MAG: hypothetical protein COC19_02515 [SAR86 cluster bacterium]
MANKKTRFSGNRGRLLILMLILLIWTLNKMNLESGQEHQNSQNQSQSSPASTGVVSFAQMSNRLHNLIVLSDSTAVDTRQAVEAKSLYMSSSGQSLSFLSAALELPQRWRGMTIAQADLGDSIATELDARCSFNIVANTVVLQIVNTQAARASSTLTILNRCVSEYWDPAETKIAAYVVGGGWTLDEAKAFDVVVSSSIMAQTGNEVNRAMADRVYPGSAEHIAINLYALLANLPLTLYTPIQSQNIAALFNIEIATMSELAFYDLRNTLTEHYKSHFSNNLQLANYLAVMAASEVPIESLESNLLILQSLTQAEFINKLMILFPR